MVPRSSTPAFLRLVAWCLFLLSYVHATGTADSYKSDAGPAIADLPWQTKPSPFMKFNNTMLQKQFTGVDFMYFSKFQLRYDSQRERNLEGWGHAEPITTLPLAFDASSEPRWKGCRIHVPKDQGRLCTKPYARD